MADEYREVTRTSYGSRIMNSFIGALIGLGLFLGAFVLLWWGEGRSIERARALDEGLAQVVSVKPDSVSDANNNKLVHTSGKITTDDVLNDSRFGVSENALKLKRIVEMYQWKESKKTETQENLGGSQTDTTVYSYDKEWSERLIDSSEFKKRDGHTNPKSKGEDSKDWAAENIHLGAFTLATAFTDQISDYEDYPLSQKNFDEMDGSLQQKFKLSGHEYISGDADSPKVGDLRVRFEIIKPYDASIVGKQSGSTLDSFQTSHGSLELLQSGTVDAQGMFAKAKDDNKILTWIIRIGGTFMMVLGFSLFLGPIRTLGAVVPFIGTILGAGAGLVAIVICVPLSIITIALAWLFYRPVIGGIALAIALVIMFGGVKMLKEKIRSKMGTQSAEQPIVQKV